MEIKEHLRGYIAGFLDADGSIYVKLKRSDDYRYGFQVCPYVVFYQAKENKFGLDKIQKSLKFGYLRERKDGIVEYIIGDVRSIMKIMELVKPYVILKKRHIDLMLKILKRKNNIKNEKDFLKLCLLIDEFKKINYSKRRKNTIKEVNKVLRQKGLLTP